MEALSRGPDAGPFLVTTVDTIAPPGTFASFVTRATAIPDADVVLALTTNVDDEKPFRVRLADGAAVAAFDDGPYATAGYSMVRATVLREADAARGAGLGALRQFFAYLFARGFRFAGVCMPDSIDVDRDVDVAAADQLIRNTGSAAPRS